MKKVKTIRCTSCGSALVEDLGGGIGKCSHCQSTMLLPKQNEEIIALLNTAHVYRENFNYDLAIKSYQYVLEKDSQELSAYEGILLSEYGIEYVKDRYSNKLIPTCHRAHFKSILEDDNYKSLISLADENQKQVIVKKALEIDRLQKAIERQLKNEDSYDVFISYKATDSNGDKTEDSIIARNIYEELTNKNYKVFFSEKSLEDRLGSEYEPIIFKALHTAKIFILVGTKKENIESTWVRNEWSRFIDRIKNEPQILSGNNFIPVFKDMNPYDFPKINNNFVQGVDANKLGYTLTILDGVQKMLKPEKEKKVLDTFDNVDNIEQFEKIRKQRTKEIKEKNWKDLQTNPNKKTKKIFYNMFLYLPYLFALLSFILTFNKHTWFLRNVEFYFWLLFISLLLITSIITVVVHNKRYPLKKLLHVFIPFGSLFLTITLVITFALTIPIGPFGAKAINNTGSEYRNGMFYSYYTNELNAYTYVAVRVPVNNGVNSYITNKDGKNYLEIPSTYKGLDVIEIYFYLEKNIDVIVIPKGVTRVDFIKKDLNIKVKEIHNYSSLTYFEFKDVFNNMIESDVNIINK